MSSIDRKYAHEIYPHPQYGLVRPLAEDVPYLYARALGLEPGDSWHDALDSKDNARRALAMSRTNHLVAAREIALTADALLQGLSGDEAWKWAQERANEGSGEWIWERAVHYGVDPEAIKPYPLRSTKEASDDQPE